MTARRDDEAARRAVFNADALRMAHLARAAAQAAALRSCELRAQTIAIRARHSADSEATRSPRTR